MFALRMVLKSFEYHDEEPLEDGVKLSVLHDDTYDYYVDTSEFDDFNSLDTAEIVRVLVAIDEDSAFTQQALQINSSDGSRAIVIEYQSPAYTNNAEGAFLEITQYGHARRLRRVIVDSTNLTTYTCSTEKDRDSVVLKTSRKCKIRCIEGHENPLKEIAIIQRLNELTVKLQFLSRKYNPRH